MKRALGRGLGALLPATEIEEPGRLRDLPIERLVPNPQQPRRHFDESDLSELAGSIKTHGVLQPILVRPIAGGKFEIVAGERRWRAAQRAGLQPEPRKYKPHVTLAYCRGTTDRDVALFQEEAGAFRTDTFWVDQFCMYSSHQTRSGSQYVEQATYPLTGKPG